MSFWRPFAFHIPTIDSILDRQSVTLEDVLDEEQVLQETKSQNKKLLNFLSQNDNLKRMINYITTEPEETSDYKHRVRYPNLSAEILSLENVPLFSDIIYEEETLLDQLYSFILNEPEHPTLMTPLLASYSSKVVCNIMQFKIPQTVEYLKKKDIISKLVANIRNSPTLDVLLKAIYCEHTHMNPELGVSQILIEKELIPSLIGNFQPDQDSDSHEAAAHALVEIILICSRAGVSSPILNQLESKDMANRLFTYTLSEVSTTELIHGLSVVNELLRRNSLVQSPAQPQRPVQFAQPNDLPPPTSPPPPPRADLDPNTLPSFIETTLSYIPNLMAILQATFPGEDRCLQTSVGEQKFFGFRRMKVLETLASLANTGFPAVFHALLSKNVYTLCLDTFFEYQWNNFIHATVEQMIIPLSASHLSFLQLVKDFGLADRIVEVTKQNQAEEESNQPSVFRRGYMGHVMNISRLIETTTATSEPLKTYLQENENWQQYVEGIYKETIHRQKRPFIPSHTQTPSFEEQNQDYGQMDQNYMDFQDDFTDFLYPEEGELNYDGEQQFNYNQNEHINQYEDDDSEDDSEGDEDTDEEGGDSDEEQTGQNVEQTN